MGVVTISRQYGAGGRRVAEALASALGFTLVDREIVEQAAARAGVDPEVAEHLDERAPSLIEDVGLALAAANPEIGLAAPIRDDRILADGIRKLVESMAETGGYVILGRGAQAILRDRRDVSSIYLVGEFEDRAKRIVELQGCSLKEAKERCRRFDDERAGFVRRFYGTSIADPLLYDAVLNTTRLGLEGAAAAALAVARARIG